MREDEFVYNVIMFLKNFSWRLGAGGNEENYGLNYNVYVHMMKMFWA